MSFSARDILPILMIVASVWAFFGLVIPRYETVQALRAEKMQYLDTLEKAENARHLREVLLDDYNSIRPEDWKKLGKMLPNRSDGVQLVRDMDGLAKMFGIQLSGFSFTEEAISESSNQNSGLPMPPDGTLTEDGTDPLAQDGIAIPTIVAPQVKKLKLAFDFQATYPDFMRFLREIEKSLELSDVRSISLSRGSSSGGSTEDGQTVSQNVYNINLQIDTYWVN